MSNQSIHRQKGAASIFIVLFFAILIGVITMSFIRIATQDQQQASINDLTQSAYDSAEAGVEDATRALRNYQTKCITAAAPAGTCAAQNAALTTGANGDCNLNASGLTTSVTGEVKVKSSTEDEALSQAYTCVVVATQTPDYTKTATADENYIVPLTKIGTEPIARIQINWFSTRDLDGASATFPSVIGELPKSRAAWGEKAPPIMRTQLISFPRTNIDIDQLNLNARTVFLYPNSSVGSDLVDMNTADNNPRGEKIISPTPIKCVPGAKFTCTANLTPIPTPGGTDTEYYLRIGSLYNNTDFQVVLYDAAGNVIDFDNVEPMIDATGRANDVFRHVLQRVEYQSNSSNLARYGGFDITEGICKDFHVSTRVTDYKHNCTRSELVNP